MSSMPLGVWKSKWEIHREDMDRYREDIERHREESEQRDAEYRGELREQRLRSDLIAAETRDLRADYERELSETRVFNRELLLRMEKTYANLNASLVYVGEELSELKAAVRAQTDAIMRLVDRFEEPEGRPPV